MNFMKTVAEKEFWGDLKEEAKAYLFQRRYQKALLGETPWEEEWMLAATKMSTKLAISWRRFFKRSLDIVASLFGLLAASPVMVLVALAVKLDSSGAIFFKQARVGMRGKVFTMFKFRTMCENAEQKTGPVWARANDSRVTRMGRFLRKTHLDELPQLFNVLKGEMSLVGPRPERPCFVNEFRKVIPHYERRLCVKPGITGLAQIRRGYDETIKDVKKKVRYDFLYVQKMCPLLDVRVLAMTVGAVLLRTGR